MRLKDHLFEGQIQDMAKKFVTFEKYIKSIMDTSAKNPAKANDIMREAFKELDENIKKALRVK